MVASTPTLVTFLLYFLAIIAVGLVGYRHTTDLSDYILGGRKLGSVVTALAAGASDMSGWLLMGLPGAIYLGGLSGAWIAIGLIIGAFLNWTYVAPRLRLFTEKYGNALTLPQYLTNRFADKSNLLRIVSAVAILIFFTFYCSAGMVAGARLFESIFGISYTVAIWIGAIATISYVLIGGFFAVSWTDTIQATLMITALLITPLVIMYANGGFTATMHAITSIHPDHVNLFSHMTAISIISMLGWGLGYFGQPHILVRFMAAKSAKNLPHAKRISMTWMILCLSGAVSVGFFAVAYFSTHPAEGVAVTLNAEKVFIETAIHLFNPWIAGLLLSAILGAVMSTLSCHLLMCSSALTEDIYKTFLRKKASQPELIWISRAMVLMISLIALFLASNPTSGILAMVSYAWAGFGSAFGPVILLSLLWPRMTRNGALAGILIGALTVLVWKNFAWFGLYEIVPGFAFGLIAIFIVSKLDAIPATSIDTQFRDANSELKALI